jgi:hypothetical protein
MTGIVYHKSRRVNWHISRHTYLVDVGSEIVVPQMEVSDLYEDQMLDPPFPETRFFEIEIEEVRKTGTRIFAFQNIYPVHAKKKPDWHILKFRIRRGSWSITERIQARTPQGISQWIYTDDFNILFLSSGGRHDPEMLLSLITGKLDCIAQSICAGTRIPSEFENQLSCRTAFSSIFSDGIDGAFREAVIYRDHAQALLTGDLDAASPRTAASEICSHHGRAQVSNTKVAEVHVDLDQIDEMKDLSWLND